MAYITLFRFWEDAECARLGIPSCADPRSAFPGRISMAAVGWRHFHPLSRDLSLHLRHGRGPGGSHSRVAINRFGWSPLEHITEVFGYTAEHVVAIARHDYFHQSGKNGASNWLFMSPRCPAPTFPYSLVRHSSHIGSLHPVVDLQRGNVPVET